MVVFIYLINEWLFLHISVVHAISAVYKMSGDLKNKANVASTAKLHVKYRDTQHRITLQNTPSTLVD